jgi:hypothetical protein
MGTRKTNQTTEKIDCKICEQEYSPECDYRQGRCPHHPSMLDIILSSSYKSRFYNLIKFFKGK